MDACGSSVFLTEEQNLQTGVFTRNDQAKAFSLQGCENLSDLYQHKAMPSW